MSKNKSRLCHFTSAFAFFGLAICNQAVAQTSDSDEGDEIIVTATKRGNSTIMDVPMSIQAVGAETLERRGATEFNDFVKLVPGLSISDQGPGNKRYVLRGISSGGAGTVGVYLDEIVLTGENAQSGGGLQPDPRLYDIERVEILKGPQGTTFGSSALSGVIRYVINKPDLETFGVIARAAISDQRGAGIGGNVDLTANIPVISDVFALRASVFVQGRPGYIDNRYEDGVNTEETYSARVQARVKFSDRAKLDLFYQYQNTDAGLSYYNTLDFAGNAVPLYYQSAPERVGFKDRQKLFNGTFNYETDIGTFTATASHTERNITFNRPATQVLAASAKVSPNDPNIRSVLLNPRVNKLDSAEVRFSSDWGGPVQILTGVFYQKDNRNFASKIPTVGANGYIDNTGGIYGALLQDRSLHTEIEEKAFFGEATWDVTDKLQVVGGLRAFKFDNESQGYVTLGVLGRPGAGAGPVSRSKASSVIGRGIISYNFTPRTKLYAQVAQGYRPGGTNDQAAAALGGATVPSGFDSDKLVNYELGLKHSSDDRRFTFTLAGFYIDWSNIQLSLNTAPSASGTRYAYTGNAGKARIYGGELEATLRPVDRVRLAASGAYTNATVREDIAGAGVKGDPIPYTPRWSGTLSADYDFPIGGHDAFVGGDVNYQGKRFNNFPNNGLNYFKLDGYTTVSARAGVQLDPARVSLVVRNLLDDKTVNDIFLQQQPTTLLGYFRNAPRTISLEVGVSF